MHDFWTISAASVKKQHLINYRQKNPTTFKHKFSRPPHWVIMSLEISQWSIWSHLVSYKSLGLYETIKELKAHCE